MVIPFLHPLKSDVRVQGINTKKKRFVLGFNPLFLSVGIIFFLLNAVSAQKSFPKPKIPFHPNRYVCYRTDAPLKMDGKLDEPSWQKAAWTDDFVDIEGPLKPKPRFKTRAKMLWDDRYFYVGANLQEPQVWANLKQRDTVIFYDNDFEIFIDPDGDTHQYYELEMNALGTYWDLLLTRPYRDGNCAISAWDIPGLKRAVWIDGTLNDPSDTDRGWQIEVAIPWAALKECAHRPAPPMDGDQWRVNFSRVEWKTVIKNGRYQKQINPQTGKPFAEDNWVWSPQGLIAMHYPEMWGFVQFSTKTAEQSKETFHWNPDEDAKWALFNVYYAQRDYLNRHGKYTTNVKALHLTPRKIPGYQWPPVIETTSSFFEAILFATNGRKAWAIRQDGKVWLKKKK